MNWFDYNEKGVCPYKDRCEWYGTDGCKPNCAYYHLTQKQYTLSKIPALFMEDITLEVEKDDVDYKAKNLLVKYKDTILERVENGQGVLIYSENVGNGKTAWAVSIGKAYIQAMVFNEGKSSVKPMVRYVNVPEMIEQLKADMGTSEDNVHISKILESDMIIMDELGAGNNTEWSSKVIYNMVNRCYVEKIPLIVTSNLTPQKIADKVDARVMDRINDMGPSLYFKGESRRKAKAWWLDE